MLKRFIINYGAPQNRGRTMQLRTTVSQTYRKTTCLSHRRNIKCHKKPLCSLMHVNKSCVTKWERFTQMGEIHPNGRDSPKGEGFTQMR